MHGTWLGGGQVGDIQNMFKAEKASWPDTLTWIPTDKLSSGTAVSRLGLGTTMGSDMRLVL